MCCSPLSGPKGVSRTLARASFGLTLLFMGIAYYLKMESFASLMSEGLANTQVAFLGPVMTYVLPALMIIGGFTYTIGFLMTIGAWATGIALGLFPVLMMLKAIVSPDIEPTSVMPFVIYGMAWLIAFMLVSKGGCGSMCGHGSAMGCACGKDNCDCPMPGSDDDYSVKSAPKKIVVRKTTAGKKK